MPTAYILLLVKIGHEEEIIQKINKILEKERQIEYEAHQIFGIYDIIIKLTAETDERLQFLALQKIRPLEYIQSTVTMLVIK